MTNWNRFLIDDWDTKIPHDGWITKWKYTVASDRAGYRVYLMVWRPVCISIHLQWSQHFHRSFQVYKASIPKINLQLAIGNEKDTTYTDLVHRVRRLVLGCGRKEVNIVVQLTYLTMGRKLLSGKYPNAMKVPLCLRLTTFTRKLTLAHLPYVGWGCIPGMLCISYNIAMVTSVDAFNWYFRRIETAMMMMSSLILFVLHFMILFDIQAKYYLHRTMR